MLIDISRPPFPGSPHWPGDRPPAFRLNARITDGASCNVGELSLSVHNGSHVDAPFHYDNHGATIDALDPELFVGPARVIDARGRTELTADLFSGLTDRELAASPRILFFRVPSIFSILGTLIRTALAREMISYLKPQLLDTPPLLGSRVKFSMASS